MVSRVLLRKLRREIWSRKGSLLALVAIIAVGIGCFVGMVAVYRDMDGSRHRYYTKYRIADFTVDLKRVPEWALRGAASLPNVRELRGRVSLPVLIDMPWMSEPVSGTAISMPAERVPVINGILLRSGTWFSSGEGREVILNEAFARENKIKPGHRIKVLLLDRQHEFLVVGTAMSPEFVYLIPPGAGLAPDPARFGVMYLPERFMQDSCDLRGAYNQIVGLAHDNTRTPLRNTLKLMAEKLDPYGVTNTTPHQDNVSIRFLADELAGLKVSATIMPVIFLGVAALILNVILSRLVAQQRTIIGTLRALGYSSGAIIRHYLSFGIIVGLLGGVFGILMGIWLQNTMIGIYRQFYALPAAKPHFYADILLFGMAIGICFALIGTIRGARSAAKLEPAEAMQPPPPEIGRAILVERIGFLWKRLPFRWKMILRAIFRNPFRSMVSVFACLVSTALVLVTFSMMDSMHYLVDYEFSRISHQDMTIALRNPEGRRAEPEIRAVGAVAYTEPQLIVACDVANGPYRKRLGITGIAKGNRLYTPLDRSGKPIALPENGLVLARKLAENLKVKPGDYLKLRPLMGRREEVTATIAATVDTFLGLSAYADIGYLSRLIGEERAANVILVKKYAGASDGRVLSELKTRPAVVGIADRNRALYQLDKIFNEQMGTSIGIMVLFAGLIAFGSVLNAALVSLSERRREVGSLRVLGYTPRQIFRIFGGESLLLNGIGIVLGLFAGVGLAHLLSHAYNTDLYRFPTIITAASVIITIVLIIFFIGAAQLIVYRIIRRLNWLEVLKVKE